MRSVSLRCSDVRSSVIQHPPYEHDRSITCAILILAVPTVLSFFACIPALLYGCAVLRTSSRPFQNPEVRFAARFYFSFRSIGRTDRATPYKRDEGSLNYAHHFNPVHNTRGPQHRNAPSGNGSSGAPSRHSTKAIRSSASRAQCPLRAWTGICSTRDFGEALKSDRATRRSA